MEQLQVKHYVLFNGLNVFNIQNMGRYLER